MRILVADDDRIARCFLVTSLTRAGHEVEAFDDGQALWEAWVSRPSATIVSDWMMPRATGIEVCRRVRAAAQAPVRFVMVTSLALEEHVASAYDAGVDELLCKPGDAADLVRRVEGRGRGVLERYRTLFRQRLAALTERLGEHHPHVASLRRDLAAASADMRRAG